MVSTDGGVRRGLRWGGVIFYIVQLIKVVFEAKPESALEQSGATHDQHCPKEDFFLAQKNLPTKAIRITEMESPSGPIKLPSPKIVIPSYGRPIFGSTEESIPILT